MRKILFEEIDCLFSDCEQKKEAAFRLQDKTTIVNIIQKLDNLQEEYEDFVKHYNFAVFKQIRPQFRKKYNEDGDGIIHNNGPRASRGLFDSDDEDLRVENQNFHLKDSCQRQKNFNSSSDEEDQQMENALPAPRAESFRKKSVQTRNNDLPQTKKCETYTDCRKNYSICADQDLMNLKSDLDNIKNNVSSQIKSEDKFIGKVSKFRSKD